MITKLSLRNFKSVEYQDYDFTQLDLFVGWNNSGKSTVLQALAIWQFCVDEFKRSKRAGNKGTQVILPNFTALPVPVFNLLWHNKKDRNYPEVEVDGEKKKQQQYILIGIEVTWRDNSGLEHTLAVDLRYQTPQTIYAIPRAGWGEFRKLEIAQCLPVIAYVPPFSGLEPLEERRDDAVLRRQVGKAQPGSVLRNLLLKVCPVQEAGSPREKRQTTENWTEIQSVIKRWFGVDLMEPAYLDGRDTTITCEYKQNGESFDIIAGGSGFHQTLTILAFLYGYNPTSILLDEPDAHMYGSLQREVLEYFKKKCVERRIQFLVATHAEEFIRGVDHDQVVSLLRGKPERIPSSKPVIRAMASLTNLEVTKLRVSPVIVYVEGEDDERIIRAWAPTVGADVWMQKIVFHHMHGGTKVLMKDAAENHYETVRAVIPNVRRVMVFDYDSQELAFHPLSTNPTLFEWGRKNIDNYLLVKDAWIRAVSAANAGELFEPPCVSKINEKFASENITLPPGSTWRNVSANIFKVVNGKEILFSSSDSLFNSLRAISLEMSFNRETVASLMLETELHDDIYALFEKLKDAVDQAEVGIS